ncbi:CRISPR-associated helicase/endonuclease Cas3 [Sesbania bispinosa]|nr:CRISPR-associated helicase/endonuclease Cas3 [Sesbania bispinosa]
MTPRRLSFTFEDFTYLEREMLDLNTITGGELPHGERGNTFLSTLGMNETRNREELNLIGSMEMPVTTTGATSCPLHTMIPNYDHP